MRALLSTLFVLFHLSFSFNSFIFAGAHNEPPLVARVLGEGDIPKAVLVTEESQLSAAEEKDLIQALDSSNSVLLNTVKSYFEARKKFQKGLSQAEKALVCDRSKHFCRIWSWRIFSVLHTAGNVAGTVLLWQKGNEVSSDTHEWIKWALSGVFVVSPSWILNAFSYSPAPMCKFFRSQCFDWRACCLPFHRHPHTPSSRVTERKEKRMVQLEQFQRLIGLVKDLYLKTEEGGKYLSQYYKLYKECLKGEDPLTLEAYKARLKELFETNSSLSFQNDQSLEDDHSLGEIVDLLTKPDSLLESV